MGVGVFLQGTMLGCAPYKGRAPKSSPVGDGGPPDASKLKAPERLAFHVDARVSVGEKESRRMKIRFYGAAPDRFRVEVRGTVGGIALVATGRGGRVRIV